MMQTIAEFDAQWIATGRTRQIPDGAGAPIGWTRTALPDVPAGKFARFTKGKFLIVDERPLALPAPVPISVTKRQFVQQLIAEGLDDKVESILDAITDSVEKKLMRSWFRDSNEFERDRPELIQVAEKLEKSEQEIDEFFRRADAR